MVACLIVKFPFDWVQDNKSISFQNFSRLPMTDSLADWARNNPKPLKDG
jgi:hypothetical protein